MNTKVKTILQQLLQSPRRYPVELALGVVFFIIAVWDSETHVWNEKTTKETQGLVPVSLNHKENMTVAGICLITKV